MIVTSAVRRLFSLVWLSLISISMAVSAAPSDKPPFYQIDYQGQTAYLLGSIHVGDASFYPLPKPIERAFTQSAGLVVEADVRGANVAELLAKYGTGKLAMDQQTKNVMTAYCQDKQRQCAALENYAPWLQSMQLSVGRYAALGYSGEYGIDAVLISQAGSKPVYELESTEFQFKLLASFDTKTQWQMVTEAIEAPDSDMLALISAWRSGDETELADLMEGEMIRDGNTEMVEKMLWDRNKGMAGKLIELMSSSTTKQPLFVVVGAGHLVGAKSVQSYLAPYGVSSKNCWQSRCK